MDPVESRIVSGTWQIATAGARVGDQAWSTAKADSSGQFTGDAANGGYFSWSFDLTTPGTYRLSAPGASLVYVDGTLRPGDPYSTGTFALPVQLTKGKHELLFLCGRGSLKASLTPCEPAISLDGSDMTVPDIFAKDFREHWVGVKVMNATTEWARNLEIEIVAGNRTTSTPIGPILPMSVRKVVGRIPRGEVTEATIRLKRGTTVISELPFKLELRKPHEPYQRTFKSKIDGSVQYYAVQPSTTDDPHQALVLSLHGASVEAISQARAYGAKSWCHIVCPTNRRPFGFDWEGIGREDALEVLALASDELATDPQRTYLTGHSMGGHGSWQIGAHYPDRFAAVAPSAGWISFETYIGGGAPKNPTEMETLLRRASADSQTLLLASNFADQAIYVLHGDADDNVPVTEARAMRQALAAGGWGQVQWFERKGAGHWWDDSPDPGADCVDWPPMFDLFARRRIPAASEIRHVDLTFVDPAAGTSAYWLLGATQDRPFMPSRVTLDWSPLANRASAAVQNATSFRLADIGVRTLVIEGKEIPVPTRPDGDYELNVFLANGQWGTSWIEPVKTRSKPMTLVVRPAKDPKIMAALLGLARYDAELFLYRGNGSLDVDVTTLADPNPRAMIYEWIEPTAIPEAVSILGVKKLLPGQCLFLRGSDGLRIMASDVAGFRLAERVPLFTSGARIPDLLLLDPSYLAKGSSGVRLAGMRSANGTFRTGDWVAQP